MRKLGIAMPKLILAQSGGSELKEGEATLLPIYLYPDFSEFSMFSGAIPLLYSTISIMIF